MRLVTSWYPSTMYQPSQQSPQQFTSPHLSQGTISEYYTGLPTTPPTQPYLLPPSSPFDYPNIGRPTLLQPQSTVQMLSQELVAAHTRLSQYTNMISNLSAELERILNIVCHECKEKISLVNLPQHLSMPASPIPVLAAELHDHQTAPVPYLHDPRPTISHPAPHTSIPSAVSFPEPTEPQITKSTGWSVIYDGQVRQALDITFLHAFEHRSFVRTVRFSFDGEFIAAGHDYELGKTEIYDVTTRSKRCTLAEYLGYFDKKQRPHSIRCLCFSPDGRHVAVGGWTGLIYVWRIANKRLLTAFKAHTGTVRALDYSPDGRLLASSSFDCSVRIRRTRDGRSSKTLFSNSERHFRSVKFTPDGRYVAASNGDVLIWDVRSCQLVGKWDSRDGVITCFAFAPDGRELIGGSANRDGSVNSWDLSSLLKTPWAKSSFSSEQQHVEEDGTTNRRVLKFDAHSEGVRSIAVSPDGKWIMTGSCDQRVRIWDRHTAVLQCTLVGHVDQLWAVDFSPVGNYIATGSDDGFVTLWSYQIV